MIDEMMSLRGLIENETIVLMPEGGRLAVEVRGDLAAILALGQNVDTAAMNLLLVEIAAQVAPDAHAVVILDRAGWHGANALLVPDNITLVPLPPYSPELNPVENLWQFLKHNFVDRRGIGTPLAG